MGWRFSPKLKIGCHAHDSPLNLLNQLLNHVMHTSVIPLDALLKNIITQKKVTTTGEITS